MSWKTNRRVKRTQQKRRRPADGRPVLFLDVDGVISLFGFHPSGPPPGKFHSIDGVIHCIGSDVAVRLRRLADVYELVWATGWEERRTSTSSTSSSCPATSPSSPST